MTITTLILLLATGILAVNAVDNCPSGQHTITNCCDLSLSTKYFFNFGRNAKVSALSGTYLMSNFCGNTSVIAEAYCEYCHGGGWLVVQRIQDGSVDFNKGWEEYEDGFGNLTGEFWYGLRALHCLTGQGGWEMRMDMKLANGTNIFLQYEQFKVASAKDKYKLSVGGFQGTTSDPMTIHNGMYFTTKDNDNDKRNNQNCALLSSPTAPNGGWWYNGCYDINLNNYYNHPTRALGIYLNNEWIKQPPFTEMKIRPHNCNI